MTDVQAKSNTEPQNEEAEILRASASDMALVHLLLDGDKAAFSGLIETHYGSMKRLAMGFVSNEAAAEEMVQETWLAVLTGLKNFKGRSSLKSWVFSILVNKSKTCGVKDKRSVPFSSFAKSNDKNEPAVSPERFNKRGMWQDPPEAWGKNTPEGFVLKKETHEVLLLAIDCLEPKQRMVVTLRNIEDMDSVEVCNILGISETYERVLLHRARSALRCKLESFMKGK